MSKLSIDQKTIEALFSDKKTDFLIPDYQRPYAWEAKECQQLWEDIFSFAFPDDDYEKFNNDDEYYLGTIVTFKNLNSKLEVIDGQQRLTTLMLLLRAFYAKFGNMKDKNSVSTKETIGKCIWKGDEFGNLNVDVLKIDSQVATDNDKDEFLKILREGAAPKEMKSKYAENYRFFDTIEQNNNEKGNIPLLIIDVNIGQGIKQKIYVYEGDTSEALAEKFAKEYKLEPDVKNKLKSLIQSHMERLLTKTVEENIPNQRKYKNVYRIKNK